MAVIRVGNFAAYKSDVIACGVDMALREVHHSDIRSIFDRTRAYVHRHSPNFARTLRDCDFTKDVYYALKLFRDHEYMVENTNRRVTA